MFLPQSQPHHLSRSYGAPGTARRGGRDKENAGVLPSKTPVRAPLGKAGPSTAGRPLGAKTPGMLGKTPANLGKTPGMLGKTPAVLGTKNVERNIMPSKQPAEDIEPKRLFQQAPAGPSKAHKTPGRALRTPAPQRVEAPTPAPLPSAQRTRRRSRSSLQHHTPAAWEEEVSLDSILEAEIELPEPATQEDADVELEYAGPTAIDRPYEPEWARDMPDPVETMAKLAKMPPLMPPLHLSRPPPFTDNVEMPKIQLCSDDDLEHPLFRKKPAPAEAGARRPLSSIVNGRPQISRPLSSTAKPQKSASRLGQAPPVRPQTSASTRVDAARPARPMSTTSAGTVKSAEPRVPVRPTTRPASSTSSLRQPGGAAPRLPSSKASSTRPVTARPGPPSTAASRSGAPSRPVSTQRPVPPPELPSPELNAFDDEPLDLDFDMLDELQLRPVLPEEPALPVAESINTPEASEHAPEASEPIPPIEQLTLSDATEQSPTDIPQPTPADESHADLTESDLTGSDMDLTIAL